MQIDPQDFLKQMGFFIEDNVNFNNLIGGEGDESERKSLMETSAHHVKDLRMSQFPSMSVKKTVKNNVRQTAAFDLFKEMNKSVADHETVNFSLNSMRSGI